MKTSKVSLFVVLLFAISTGLCAQTAEEWKKLGNLELDSANYNKAIEFYEQALEVDSNYFDAYYNLGSAYSSLQEYDKAITYYNKAITKNDTIPAAYYALGSVYTDKKEYDKAIEAVKEGINMDSIPSTEVYLYLSYLYGEAGRPVYETLYVRKAAQLGDTLAQQLLIDNEIPWENTFVKPDYEEIKANIADKKSNLYYPKLWKRYQEGSGYMTLEEKRHLYYGYVFHKNYSPYISIFDSEQAKAILSKEEPTQSEWKKLIALLDAALNVEPFQCRYLHYQSVAYNNLKEFDKATQIDWKRECIIDALSSTGDGLERESAIHVITVASEYDYLYFNYLSMKEQSLISGGYDLLRLDSNERALEELWFDVNQPLNFLNKAMK